MNRKPILVAYATDEGFSVEMIDELDVAFYESLGAALFGSMIKKGANPSKMLEHLEKHLSLSRKIEGVAPPVVLSGGKG